MRERWPFVSPATLFELARASAACLPPGEGLARVESALRALPDEARVEAIVALSWFHDGRALAVLESLLTSPVVESYGRVAASIGVSWPVVEDWLERGRPMSLVALDALVALVRLDTPLLREVAPVLVDPPSAADLHAALSGYAARDAEPRVLRAVSLLSRAGSTRG